MIAPGDKAAPVVEGRPVLVMVLEPLLLNADAAGRLCGVSGRTWQRLASEGAVPAPIKLGRQRRWRTVEVQDWVASGCPGRERWELLKSSGQQAAPVIDPGAARSPIRAGSGDRPPP